MEMCCILAQPIPLDRNDLIDPQGQPFRRPVDLREEFTDQRVEVGINEAPWPEELARGHFRQHVIGEGPACILEPLLRGADLVQPLLHSPDEVVEVYEQRLRRCVRDIVGDEVAVMGADLVISDVPVSIESTAVQILV